MYGSQIGRKFHEDGNAKRYPGNTVIADVCPGCAAYDLLSSMKNALLATNLVQDLILLPEDSYHITVIRGLNDLVRDAAFWPTALPADSTMIRVDDYYESAVKSVTPLGRLLMRFQDVQFTSEDLRVLVVPADDGQAAILHRYRDAVAEAVGLRLPGHDAYTFHITLAYTRVIPEGFARTALDGTLKEMNAVVKSVSNAFETEAPYVAFYNDMLRFYNHRIPRGTERSGD